ncbi:hypothetical protein [Streptomyces sp. NPDC052107]|uniref:hypothetical protein n=1 Tax=Streptomyces sp. NPDC052107 TaxID=3155632 RepID=UPI0034139937
MWGDDTEGLCESAESRADLLRDCRRRGMREPGGRHGSSSSKPTAGRGSARPGRKPTATGFAALGRVLRGYCPACKRGGAAPTVEDWEREQGHERAEADLEEVLAVFTGFGNGPTLIEAAGDDRRW